MAMVAAAAAAPVANQSELHDMERRQTSDAPRLGIADFAWQQRWDGSELERRRAGGSAGSGDHPEKTRRQRRQEQSGGSIEEAAAAAAAIAGSHIELPDESARQMTELHEYAGCRRKAGHPQSGG